MAETTEHLPTIRQLCQASLGWYCSGEFDGLKLLDYPNFPRRNITPGLLRGILNNGTLEVIGCTNLTKASGEKRYCLFSGQECVFQLADEVDNKG